MRNRSARPTAPARRFPRWLAALAVVGGSLAWTATADAAPITIPGCAVTEEDGTPIDLSLTIDTDDPVLEAYADGDYFTFADWVGQLELGAGPDESAIPALCGVRVTRLGDDITFGPPTWLWCTEIDDHVCGTGSQRPAESIMTETQETLVGWVLQTFADTGDNRQEEVYNTQNRVWCITDGRSGIEDGSAQGPYVPGDSTIETCEQYLSWLETTILPGLARADDQVSITGPAESSPAGGTQQFIVTSDVAHLTVAVDGVGSLAPCDDSATLDGDELTVAPGQPALLCVTSADAGDVEVEVTSRQRTGLLGDQFGSADPSCQVFATSDLAVRELRSAADGRFEAVQATTTSTTTTSTTGTTGTTATTTTDTTTATTDTSDGSGPTTTAAGSGGVDGSGIGTGPGVGSGAVATGELARTGTEHRVLVAVGITLVVSGVGVVLARRRLHLTS